MFSVIFSQYATTLEVQDVSSDSSRPITPGGTPYSHQEWDGSTRSGMGRRGTDFSNLSKIKNIESSILVTSRRQIRPVSGLRYVYLLT